MGRNRLGECVRSGVSLPLPSWTPAAMSIRRRTARLLALGLAGALLAAQWALASYACPLEQGGAAMAPTRAAGLPCEGTDEQQPALCHRHMAQAAQSAERARMPLPAPLLPERSVPAPAGEADGGRAAAAPLAAAQGPPAGPVYLATRRLRD